MKKNSAIRNQYWMCVWGGRQKIALFWYKCREKQVWILHLQIPFNLKELLVSRLGQKYMQLFPKIETFSCLQPTCRCSIPKICMQSHVIARGHHFAAQESKGASPDQSWVGSNKNLKIMELVEKVLFCVCVLNVGKQCIKETCLSGCN